MLCFEHLLMKVTRFLCNLNLLAKAHNLPSDEAQAALIDERTEADSMGCLVNDLLTLARSDEMAQELTTLVRVNNAMYFSSHGRRPNHPLNVRYSRHSLLLASHLLSRIAHQY